MDTTTSMSDLVEEVVPLRRPRPAAAAPARRRGAARRGGVRPRRVPAVLGGAVAELARARAHGRGSLAARRAHAGARLRARAPEHRGGAGRRARAGDRLVARRGRDDAANAERNGARLETLVCSWTEPAPLLDAGAVGPRARLRRALRGAQRATRCSPLLPRLGPRGVARRPRPGPGRRASSRPPARLGDQPTGARRSWPTARCTGCVGFARRDQPVAPYSARVLVPPRRRRRCGTEPSNSTASPSYSAWTVPPRSTSSTPRTHVDAHLAGGRLGLVGPRLGRRTTTRASAARRARPGCRGRRRGCALGPAHDDRAPPAAGVHSALHRYLERARDALHGADARPREPALELAQERMRQPGLAAEGLQREPAVAPQLAHACAEAGRGVRGTVGLSCSTMFQSIGETRVACWRRRVPADSGPGRVWWRSSARRAPGSDRMQVAGASCAGSMGP